MHHAGAGLREGGDKKNIRVGALWAVSDPEYVDGDISDACPISQSVPVEIIYLICDKLAAYKDFFHFRIACTAMYDTLASYHEMIWKKVLAATRVQRCWRRNRHYCLKHTNYWVWLGQQDLLGINLAPDRVVMRRGWLLRNMPLRVTTYTADTLRVDENILVFSLARFSDFMLDFSVESSPPMDYKLIEEVTFFVGDNVLCKWSGKNAQRKNYSLPWPFPLQAVPYHKITVYVNVGTHIKSTFSLHVRGCNHFNLGALVHQARSYIPYIPSLHPTVQLYAANEAGIDASDKPHMLVFTDGRCTPSLGRPYRIEGRTYGGFLNWRNINFVPLALLYGDSTAQHTLGSP